MITVAAGGRRADELAARVRAEGWQGVSCAEGSKGPRLYDWALIEAASPGHWLMARRSLAPGEKGQLELAYFRCWAPRPVTLPELAAVAGARWAVEDCFGEPKTKPALTNNQAPRHRPWYRHAPSSSPSSQF